MRKENKRSYSYRCGAAHARLDELAVLVNKWELEEWKKKRAIKSDEQALTRGAVDTRTVDAWRDSCSNTTTPR